jgi:hypothetical protein
MMTDLTQSTSWLHEQPTWLIVLGLMAGMMISARLGFALGRRWQAETGETGRGHFNAVQASLLGLLALLLGFTINMANQLHDARRQLVVEDANNLAALHLRGTYLPEPARAEFARLLRGYVGTRADPEFLKREVTRAEMAARAQSAQTLHSQMCELVRVEAQGEHPAKGIEAMVSLLSDAQGILRRRVHAFQSRVPDSIIGLLLAAAVGGAGVVGYSGGLGQHRGTVQSVLLTLFVSATCYVILDLDRPMHGLMQVDQTPILQLNEFLDREATQPK